MNDRWRHCKLIPKYRSKGIVALSPGTLTFRKMIAPTYVAENAPRGIRGLLVGFYQLFETMGAMVAFFINYGSLLHLKGKATWMVPLSMQSLPPLLLFVSIFFCPESPRKSFMFHTVDTHQYATCDVTGVVCSLLTRNLRVDSACIMEIDTDHNQQDGLPQGMIGTRLHKFFPLCANCHRHILIFKQSFWKCKQP